MKYRINYKSVAHGAISWSHEGKDSQYCEAGEPVVLSWQPTTGWGLAEAHYTDGDGNVTAIDIESRTFTMPASDITIGGTFKRFVLEDWTGDKDVTKGPVVSLGSFDASELPHLEGDEAVGTMAFVNVKNKYAVWNGNYWTFMDGTPVVPQWLKFTANEDGSSVGFCCWSEDYEQVDMGKELEYSTDGGVTWDEYTIGIGEENVVPIDLDEGESVLFRGVNENLAYYLEDDADYIYTKCIINGSVAASGDITSLLNGVGGDVSLPDHCYSGMFQDCTGLTSAPALPATTLDTDCYSYIFQGCTGLTSAPALPATTLESGCYSGMFFGCTGLTSAPVLPATTLDSGCYSSMFQGCTHITSHHVATMNNSSNVFTNNSACDAFTIDDDTPPTIGSNTITGLKAGCIIYVPAASVDAYKAKQYWSARASYIQAKP